MQQYQQELLNNQTNIETAVAKAQLTYSRDGCIPVVDVCAPQQQQQDVCGRGLRSARPERWGDCECRMRNYFCKTFLLNLVPLLFLDW